MKKLKTLIGWREWVCLPQLNIPEIKAKIDTGAKTSCLHVVNCRRIMKRGRDYVEFTTHPIQKSERGGVRCVCPVVDERTIIDSGGHREKRLIISTLLQLGEEQYETEFSITNRGSMRYRMLLGRNILHHFYIYPQRSYLTGTFRTGMML